MGWMRIALAVALAAGCGGTKKVAQPAPLFEEDDESAKPTCWPDCQSAKWARADVRFVFFELSKCASELVLAPEDLRGQVTVRYDNVTCAEAIEIVAGSAGFTVMRAQAYRADGAGHVLVDATVVKPPETRRRFVPLAVLHSGLVRNTGVMVDRPPEGEEYEEHEHDHDALMSEWQTDRGVARTPPPPPTTTTSSPPPGGDVPPPPPAAAPQPKDTPIVRERPSPAVTGSYENPVIYHVVWK